MPLDNRIAICPGTFDPVTYGHLDVVIVAIVNLPWRKGQTLFSAEERIGFLTNATSDLPNVSIETFSNLLVEFAREKKAMAIIKGLRAISDFEYELEMNQLNRRQAPDIESVYLMASPKYSFLRSSGVKELATFGGDIDDLVPVEVAEALKERVGR
jgi:pantetheine-phosphate adenylyltransferase